MVKDTIMKLIGKRQTTPKAIPVTVYQLIRMVEQGKDPRVFLANGHEMTEATPQGIYTDSNGYEIGRWSINGGYVIYETDVVYLNASPVVIEKPRSLVFSGKVV